MAGKKKLLTIAQYVFFFGLAALLIGWQYGKLTEEDKAQITVAFEQVNQRLWLAIPVVIVGLLSHYYRALRWKLLLEPLHLKPRTITITLAVIIGYLVNLLLPRMGEVARCSILAKYEDEPVDLIVGTIVAERSFDMVCLIAITIITYLLQMDVANAYITSQGSQLNISGNAILGILFLLLIITALLIFIYKRSKQTKIGALIKGLGQGVISIFRMKRWGTFLIYTVLIWGCYLFLIVIGFKALEATEHLGWLEALSVLVFGSIGMIVTPGGIGAYPLAVQGVLATVYDINKNFALAYGWVSWLAQTLTVLVLGLLSLIILPLYNSKNGK